MPLFDFGTFDEKGLFGFPKRNLGYQERYPYASEKMYFTMNPNVSGMASQDDRIVLNPYNKFTQQQKANVAMNEAARIWMRQNNVVPDFAVTDEQLRNFQGTSYGEFKNYVPLKQTIAARTFTGDRSIRPTQQQLLFAEMMYKALGNR